MKKILAFLALGLLLGACSDKLTSSKAEKLIQEALEKEPIQGEEFIKIGDKVEFIGHSFIVKEELKPYEKLKEDGMIEMILKEKDTYGDPIYSIHLTDKGRQYLLRVEGDDIHIMKTYSATLDKVEDIHLIPEDNSAGAITHFKIEKTPFFVLESPKSQEKFEKDLVKRNIYFRKLEEKGWSVGHVGLY